MKPSLTYDRGILIIDLLIQMFFFKHSDIFTLPKKICHSYQILIEWLDTSSRMILLVSLLLQRYVILNKIFWVKQNFSNQK